jgi:hypothetical protein
LLALLLLLAARPTATLDYLAPAECPDRAALIDRVASRLGFDPFERSGGIRIAARITSARGYRGTLAIADPSAPTAGEWEKSAPKNRCAELVEEMALAISLAIDPLGAHRTATPPPTPPPPPAPPPPPPAPPPPTKTATIAIAPEPAVDTAIALGLEVGPWIGLTPGVAVGVGAGAGYRYARFAIHLRGRIAAGGRLDLDGRSGASAIAITGAALPCYSPSLGGGRRALCG